ncbi:phosphate ABC transporter membrane subunit PstC [Gammaproteobacteria bacterium]
MVVRTATRHRLGDWIFFNLTRLFALVTLLLLMGIILSLVQGAIPAIERFGFPFLWTGDWNPPMDRFGALIPIYGTLATSVVALTISIPISFGIALFLTELAPIWLRRPLGIAIELLAGIPSIVYGMWGLMIFVPIFSQYVQPTLTATLGKLPFIGGLFDGPPLGIGILSAGIILAVMTIPFIASVMRDVFETTPPMLKESAYALGATTWEVVWHVVLPYTKIGVIGGIMLGLGRALGETMAVTFLIGNMNFFNGFSLFLPGNSIASALANEFAEAESPIYTAALIELGLILFVITLIVLSLSEWLLMRLTAREGSRA